MEDQIVGLELEKQVTSLELSKELEKLGVKQDSIFWWVKHIKSGTNHYIWDLVYGKDENDLVNVYVSAFTVAEHGKRLPDYLSTHKVRDDLWECAESFYSNEEPESNIPQIEAKTEADARAKMRIWLIKNKLMEA